MPRGCFIHFTWQNMAPHGSRFNFTISASSRSIQHDGSADHAELLIDVWISLTFLCHISNLFVIIILFNTLLMDKLWNSHGFSFHVLFVYTYSKVLMELMWILINKKIVLKNYMYMGSRGYGFYIFYDQGSNIFLSLFSSIIL